MAPTKKREKDATSTTPTSTAIVNSNMSTNGTNGGGVSTLYATANVGNAANVAIAVTNIVSNNGNNGVGGGNGSNTSTANSNNNSSTNNNSAAEATKLNSHQQEQELFLQAFEKPTQIYRFLRNRHGTSPIFLNRTLSYMKERMSRNNKKRASFKVNSILDTITQKSESVSNNFLNIIYNGLYDKSASSDQWWHTGDLVCVESTLYKITKSKRKDSTSDFQEVLSHSSNIIYNPHENIGQYTSISIPVQSMRPLGDQHTIYKLLFRIKALPKYNGGQSKIEEQSDGDELPNKRSKFSGVSTKIYGCELIVFEKNIGCIPEGDYEAALQELNSNSIKSFSPKKRTWETLPDNYVPLSVKFDVFNQHPTLKFRLTWSASALPSCIEAKELSQYSGFTDSSPLNSLEDNRARVKEAQINHNNNCIKSGCGGSGSLAIKAENIQIVYNFLYSNNTRQQTEYTQEVICPWCGLDCLRLYALLKHLKLCHARFNFTYQPAGNGARIDVTINDAYDGSYAGSPYDLAGPSGCSFARTCGPVRRTTVTNLLVCRPRRQKTCLDEFLVLDEDDLSNQRPYITGHNRLYHHTETCLPVHPKELDIDSEGESDPLWLRQKTIQMIDEFSDVNEGEKELMKLWNLHVMKHGYVGDCQLPLACEMFLDSNGHEIIRKNLYRNFILHMCSLFDYGLVSPETVYKTVQKLQGILSKYPDGRELMSKQREAQLKYWLSVGIHKEDEQKLKSPQKQAVNALTSSAAAINAVAISASSSGTSASESKVMHPPGKRSATAVKRASLHTQNGHNTTDKLSSPAGSAAVGGNSKPVAKKTVTQEINEATSSLRERRSENVLRRSGSTTNTATSAEKDKGDNKGDRLLNTADATKTQAVKRKLLTKDVTQQPAGKRSRLDSSQIVTTVATITRSSSNSNFNIRQLEMKASTSGSGSGSSSSSSINNNSNATAASTLPKRLVTRRQSIASSIETASSRVKSANIVHSLRTRLSVPLTKVDKR